LFWHLTIFRFGDVFQGPNSRYQLCPDPAETEWKIIYRKTSHSQNRWRGLSNIQSFEILKTIHQGRVYGCAGFDSTGQVFVFGGWNTMTATGPHMLVRQADIIHFSFSVENFNAKISWYTVRCYNLAQFPRSKCGETSLYHIRLDCLPPRR
jgi:hypothetical protein